MCRLLHLWLLAGLSSFVATGLAADSQLAEVRSNVERWVQTRQLISQAKSDWSSDKESLEQTVALFERELRAVEEQLTSVSTNTAQIDRERQQAEELLQRSQQGLDEARQFATSFERQITAFVPRLPAPLQDLLKPFLNRLPTDPSNSKLSAAERLQTIVGVLNELDKFNSSVSIFSERRRHARGEEIAVETVYVGLGTAYFVNESGDFAGIGFPRSDGWEWVSKPELAASIREVVRIYRNERPARFVALPAAVK